jgi:hypothetical protein
MTSIIWAALVANALINARVAVLFIQDGEDRVKARVAGKFDVIRWDGIGYLFLVAWVWFAPLITTYWILKKILFPRGIKSKFAKQQEAKRAREAAATAAAERELELQRTIEDMKTWIPGSIVCEAPQQAALGWEAAADVFDIACAQVSADRGKPWTARCYAHAASDSQCQ